MVRGSNPSESGNSRVAQTIPEAHQAFYATGNRVFYVRVTLSLNKFLYDNTNYEGWNFNSGNYLFTTDTK